MKYLSLFALFVCIASANDFSPNRLIVNFKTSTPPQDLVHASKLKNLYENVFVAYTTDLKKLETELSKHPQVAKYQKDFKASKRELSTPSSEFVQDTVGEESLPFNDPLLHRQWAMRSSERSGISALNAYNEFDLSSAQEVIVAVVDTGVEVYHEDLRDIMWKNPGEIAGNGIDDDDNGYIDDIYGINTIVRDADGNPSSDVSDKHGHGTHVSGIIAAKQNNSIGVAGIAPNVKIMALRAVPNWGDETDVDVVESFIYAAKNGAKIINCSFGKSVNEDGSAVSDAIEFINKEYGTLVIAAAGNDSSNIDQYKKYPASFQNEGLLVVASSNSWGGLSYFTNYGLKNVDLAAPGSGILSTFSGGDYQSHSGTSMATPVVAGVAAVVLGLNPNYNYLDLKNYLMFHTSSVSSYEGKMQSAGRINLFKAIESSLK